LQNFVYSHKHIGTVKNDICLISIASIVSDAFFFTKIKTDFQYEAFQ